MHQLYEDSCLQHGLTKHFLQGSLKGVIIFHGESVETGLKSILVLKYELAPRFRFDTGARSPILYFVLLLLWNSQHAFDRFPLILLRELSLSFANHPSA